MKDFSGSDKINDILTRGVGEFIDPDGSFRKKLEQNPEKIVIKFGIDPTRPDIHIGHAVVLHKLRQFQDLGCKVIFLIGDYTAQIGDPTGKSKVRPEIDQQEVEANMKTYLEQVDKILKIDNKVFSWIRNSDWFTAITDIGSPSGQTETINIEGIKPFSVDANSFIGKANIFERTRMQVANIGLTQNISVITLRSFLWTLKHITHSRLIERDMFQERITKNEQLYMHEMMYPVLQGVDSFALAGIYNSCDLEVGGTDQTFNMLVGRDVMKMNNLEPQAVLAFKLLEGLDGKEKMSKSLDNYVGITDEPSNMYGKIMSIPDTSIVNYFELCTFTPLEEVEEIKQKLQDDSVNPKDLKMNLAKQIVSIYHGEKEAESAELDWVTKFEKREVPEKVDEIKGGDTVMQTLFDSGLFGSNSDVRRLFKEGAIKDLTLDKKIEEKDPPTIGHVYKIGKHRFIKIV